MATKGGGEPINHTSSRDSSRQGFQGSSRQALRDKKEVVAILSAVCVCVRAPAARRETQVSKTKKQRRQQFFLGTSRINVLRPTNTGG